MGDPRKHDLYLIRLRTQGDSRNTAYMILMKISTVEAHDFCFLRLQQHHEKELYTSNTPKKLILSKPEVQPPTTKPLTSGIKYIHFGETRMTFRRRHCGLAPLLLVYACAQV